jgi:riboflavin kinase / FMN adenylyltransferase
VRVYYNLNDFNAFRPVVTIGTFDGVHIGHRKIIDRLKEISSEINGESVVFTFHPHPRQIVSAEENSLRLINTLTEKIDLLRDTKIDHLIIYPFTTGFSEMSYIEFVEEVLVKQMQVACLVVGYDHHYGSMRKGDYEYLKKCSVEYNFRIERLDVLLVDEVNVSSTHIRRALEAGNITLANSYLGYRYELHGIVVEGRRLGRKIGFPTANIEATEITKLIPGYGVYAVFVKVRGQIYQGMLNIGTRPTFTQNADARSIEVNIFDFDDSIYQEGITLFFIDKIRNEQKFPSKEALVDQLFQDKLTTLKILSEKTLQPFTF